MTKGRGSHRPKKNKKKKERKKERKYTMDIKMLNCRGN